MKPLGCGNREAAIELGDVGGNPLRIRFKFTTNIGTMRQLNLSPGTCGLRTLTRSLRAHESRGSRSRNQCRRSVVPDQRSIRYASRSLVSSPGGDPDNLCERNRDRGDRS